MKKLFALLVSLLLCGLTAIVWFNWQWQQAIALPVVHAHSLLAQRNLVAFGFIDNQQLQPLLAGSELEAPLLASQSPAFNALYQGQVNMREHVQHLMFAATLDETPANYFLAYGQFDRAAILQALATEFEIETLANQQIKLIRQVAAPAKIDPCLAEQPVAPKPKVSYLQVDANWLLISENSVALASLSQQLTGEFNQPAAANTDWQQFAQGKIAAFTLIKPEHLSQSLTGMSRFMASSLQAQHQAAQAVYLGAAINPLQRALDVSLMIKANEQWVGENQPLLTAKLADMQLASSDYSPTLSEFFALFQVQQQQDELHVALRLQQSMLASLPQMAGEFTSSLFGGQFSNDDSDIVAEQIDESPWDFAQNALLAKLAPYQPNSFSGLPAVIKGPFAFHFEQAGFNDDQQTMELDFKMAMTVPEIEGFWLDSQAELGLTINRIEDAQGNDLLRDERCAEGYFVKNHEQATGFNSSNQTAYISKSVRLQPEVDFNDIAFVDAALSFKVPSLVQRFELAPQKGAKLSAHGVSIVIEQANQQSVSYRLQGETQNVIEVRGLNAQGQVLSSSGSYGFDDVKTVNFQGDVSRLEFYLAQQWVNQYQQVRVTKEQLLQAPLTKNHLLNRLPSTANNRSFTPFNSIDDLSLAQVNAKSLGYALYLDSQVIATSIQRPFKLMLSHNWQSSWNNQPTISVIMPLIEELAFNLQAYKLQVAGQEYYLSSRPSYQVIDQRIGKYLGETKINELPFLVDSQTIDLKLESNEQLDSLNAKLVVNLPQTMQQSEFAMPSFKQPLNLDGIDIQLTEIANGFIPGVTLSAKGDGLVNIIAITEQGDYYPQQASFTDGQWLLRFDLNPKIIGFKLLTATNSAQQFQFTLTPKY